MRLRSTTEGLSIVWWSAAFGEATGQAIVTTRVAGMLANAGGRGAVYQPGGVRALPSWLTAVFRLWALALLGKAKQVYLVCSRSNAGFLRDLPAYFLVLFGSRLVVHTHGSDIVDLCQRPWVGRLARFFLARCVLVLPSPHLKFPLQELGIVNMHCCENFFEPSSEPLSADSPSITPPQALSVLWNSNVMASKGFFVVAEAVRQLALSGRTISMIALGRCLGDEMMDAGTCTAQLERLQREPWLHYHGQVGRAESARLLGLADMVCLPSTYSSECQPLALIEAMCAARPIIIANTPALCATVGSYPCVKIDVPVRAEALASAMLVCNEQMRADVLAQAALAARERFAPQRFDHEMRALLKVPQNEIREMK
jgi:glycosyltransferase involved in cell wall biosynthesis